MISFSATVSLEYHQNSSNSLFEELQLLFYMTVVSGGTSCNKTNHGIMWNGMKICMRKYYLNLCTFLSGVTCPSEWCDYTFTSCLNYLLLQTLQPIWFDLRPAPQDCLQPSGQRSLRSPLHHGYGRSQGQVRGWRLPSLHTFKLFCLFTFSQQNCQSHIFLKAQVAPDKKERTFVLVWTVLFQKACKEHGFWSKY